MRFSKQQLAVLHSVLVAHIAMKFGHRGNSGMLSPDVRQKRDELDRLVSEIETAMLDTPPVVLIPKSDVLPEDGHEPVLEPGKVVPLDAENPRHDPV